VQNSGEKLFSEKLLVLYSKVMFRGIFKRSYFKIYKCITVNAMFISSLYASGSLFYDKAEKGNQNEIIDTLETCDWPAI